MPENVRDETPTTLLLLYLIEQKRKEIEMLEGAYWQLRAFEMEDEVEIDSPLELETPAPADAPKELEIPEEQQPADTTVAGMFQ